MKHALVGDADCIFSDGLPMAACTLAATAHSLCAAPKDGEAEWCVIASSCTPSWDTAADTRCPTNGAGYRRKQLQAERCARSITPGKIATVNGRYYCDGSRPGGGSASPRLTTRWSSGDAEGGSAPDPIQGMKDSYNKGVTDES